jgi:hypothetical protein
MKDRASRFLLIGAGASLLGGLAFSLIDLRIRWLDWQVVAYASDVVNVVSVASVIGLAGRAGRVRKPPIWLAAAALGGAFALSYGSFFLNWFQFPTFIPDQQEIPGLIGDLAEWIAAAGAAGILWVGISTGRRSRGGWAWWLVLIGGALEMAAWSENGLGFLAQARILDMSLFESSVSWANLAGSIGTTALLFALAIGLRPVPPIGDAGSAVLDPDFPDEIGPHTAVAGETAGH